MPASLAPAAARRLSLRHKVPALGTRSGAKRISASWVLILVASGEGEYAPYAPRKEVSEPVTKTRLQTFALAAMLLLPACYTASSYSREVGAAPPPRPWYRDGTVESVREVVRRTEGNPAAGAVVGSAIGALIGGSLTHSGGGLAVGAIGGAATGAAASSGRSEERYYVLAVRFDDGTRGQISYWDPPPWRPGDRVRQTRRGLEWLGRPPQDYPPASATQPPGAPPPAGAPPPPPTQPPPPPPTATPPPPGNAE